VVPRSNLANNLFASSCDSLRLIIVFGTYHLRSSSWPSVNSPSSNPLRAHAYEHEWARLSQSLRDSPVRFACISAEKRSDKGFLPLPRQRPLRWFHEALVFDAPFRSLPPETFVSFSHRFLPFASAAAIFEGLSTTGVLPCCFPSD
jgi:hypothetical protein